MLGLVGSYRNANETVVTLTNNSGARTIDKAIGDLRSSLLRIVYEIPIC